MSPARTRPREGVELSWPTECRATIVEQSGFALNRHITEIPLIYSFRLMLAFHVVHVLDESLLGGSFVESFYKRGRATLLVAKFIPGINSMAPPLAGSMKMPFIQFVGLDLLGALAYAFAYGSIGFVFRDFLASLVRGFQAAGHVVEIVVIITAIGFFIYRFSLYWRHRADRIVPRIQVAELAAKLQTQYAEKILLVDVRSHGYYDPRADRIPGSIRLEPNNLSEEAKELPRDKDIYLYCT